MYDYDLLVIGAGSGGVRSARMAAAQGIRVAIVEEKYFGGTCVNVGCVPKKLLVYGSQYSEEFKQAEGYGWRVGEAEHSWSTLIDNKNTEIERLNSIYIKLLNNAGVSIIRGRAEITGPHSVSVGEQTISAEKILITVGGKPSNPKFKGAEHCFNSDQAFYLPERPNRVAVVGGGYIGLEFAGIFNGLGSQVHVLARSQVLRGYDESIAKFAKQEIAKKGITLKEQCEIVSIEKSSGALLCQLSNGESLTVDGVMFAAGREPVTANLGLQQTAVKLRDNGTIIVNEQFQTAEPSIYALGDVIGTPELTPVALAQAMTFVDQQYGQGKRTMQYDFIPTTIFSQPNIAFIGVSEQEAKAKGLACDVYIADFRGMKHTLSGSEERTFVKLIVEQSSQKIVGLHIVGAEAGEVLQGFAVAIQAGLTKADWDATIGIHPTMAEELVTMRTVSYSF